MTPRQLCSYAIVFVLCGISVAHSQEYLRARVETASKNASLNDITDHPWHLQMSVSLFNSEKHSTQPPVKIASVEIWQNGKIRRTKLRLDDTILQRLTTADGSFTSGTDTAEFDRVDEVVNALMHPGPDEADLDDAVPELRKEASGKTPLDCIMLTHPVKAVPFQPLGLYPTFCLTRDTGHLAVSYQFGGQLLARERIGKFLDHEVALQLSDYSQSVLVARGEVTKLATYVPDAKDFVPDAEMHQEEKLFRIAGGVVAGSKIGGSPPVYPASAKAQHLQGRVILHAVIGRDGHVRSVRAVSSPSPDLTISAIAAVRTWVYKPFLLNGEPTSLDTTVTVNYNFSPY